MYAGVESNVIAVSRSGRQAGCPDCSLREICLPAGLACADMEQFDTVIGARIRVKHGQRLYRSGEAFSAIYAVRSGCFKTEATIEDGRECVTGFQFAGEILGMDGIGEELHTCNAVALEDSEVCRIPFADLERLSRQAHVLQRQFHKMMSRESVRNRGMLLLLGTLRAGERLAAFLLTLSQILATRGYSPAEFHLRMTREDIGSYLGLTLETVSRAFSRFQEAGIISVQLRHIRILDIAGLQDVGAQVSSTGRRAVSSDVNAKARPLPPPRGRHDVAPVSANCLVAPQPLRRGRRNYPFSPWPGSPAPAN